MICGLTFEVPGLEEQVLEHDAAAQPLSLQPIDDGRIELCSAAPCLSAASLRARQPSPQHVMVQAGQVLQYSSYSLLLFRKAMALSGAHLRHSGRW